MPNFQNIFNNNYPGIDSFINEVLIPIFRSEAIKKNPAPLNILEDPSKLERATLLNIKSIFHVGHIVLNRIARIELYDVTLNDNCQLSRCRVGIQQIIRSEVQHFSNIFILFHYESPEDKEWRFSFAFKGETQADTTTAKRYTYLFGKEHNSRTANDRFNHLCGQTITDKLLKEAFSVEALSKEFYDAYTIKYDAFCEFLYEHKDDPNYFDPEFQHLTDDQCDDYVKKMLGRILFLQFIQKKGWMCSDSNYTANIFKRCKYKADFLNRVLEPLFFGILNTPKPNRAAKFRKKHWNMALLHEWQTIPYLNGGLFEPDFLDQSKAVFDEQLFQDLFDLFNCYNFTIDENDPDDAEVGVDPEMLGKIFEKQLKCNEETGSYYTPKEIVQYMCRESLIAYLTTSCPQIAPDTIRKFILTHELAHEFPEEHRNALAIALREVKICDPAIGSGAFPIGMLHELYKCHTALNAEYARTPTRLKRCIIQENLYGVDIEKGAVDIARLRFWLSLVVTEECEEGREPETLPNLDYKIMQGNSLLENYQGADLSKVIPIDPPDPNNQLLMFEDSLESLKEDLSKMMRGYYRCSNHNEKVRIRQAIQDNICEQIKQFWKGGDLDEIDISATSIFFLWHTWFFDVFEKGGFDIIIGNPPYIKEGTYRSAFNGFRESSQYYMGKMDIWYGFACHAIDLLKNKGILCFIATNNWVTNAGAKKLRQKVITSTRFLQLVDFGAYMVFEDSASIQTMIMLFQVDAQADDYSFDFRRLTKQDATKKDAINFLAKNENDAIYIEPIINRIRFRRSLLTFTDVEQNAILEKINQDSVYLSKEDAINGIHPHFDFVSKKIREGHPEFSLEEGIFGLSTDELLALQLSDEEMDLIKPYYTSDQIFRYYTERRNLLWLIYTDSSFSDPHSMDNYPRLKRHLDKFSEVITSDNWPYGLHRARKERFFKGEKIVCKRKCVEHPVFSYSDFDVYVSAAFYVIKTEIYNLKFLTGLFNSKLIEFWLRHRGKMQGDNFQVDKEPILAIPIKRTSQAELSIARIVDDIIQKKNNNITSDTSAEETAIDRLVYDLYGLTPDEIAIVEGDTETTETEGRPPITNPTIGPNRRRTTPRAAN